MKEYNLNIEWLIIFEVNVEPYLYCNYSVKMSMLKGNLKCLLSQWYSRNQSSPLISSKFTCKQFLLQNFAMVDLFISHLGPFSILRRA